LKPQNILLTSATHPILAKIADFGLAKHFATAGFSGLTLTGTYAGTPLSLPREQDHHLQIRQARQRHLEHGRDDLLASCEDRR